MWSQYDENLCENEFFKYIKTNHSDILEKSAKENWIVCIPKYGNFDNTSQMCIENVLDHIILNNNEEMLYTLSRKRVQIKNHCIIVQSIDETCSDVLFEETFYISKDMRYTVWCISQPLFVKSLIPRHQSQNQSVLLIKNFHDCIDFLWSEHLNSDTLEDIQHQCAEFWQTHTNKDFETETLQTQKEFIGNLYSQCLQVCLKRIDIKEKCNSNKQFLENLKVSVETYMQYCLGRRLIFSINTLQHYSDCVVNKIIRNSDSISLNDLSIGNEFNELITQAKYELGKINNYITIQDKTNCLIQCFNIFYKNKTKNYVSSDDLLQIVVYLILKLRHINNWTANLIYIKEFRFSINDLSDQRSFIVTTLEAAIEFIKSNDFLTLRNKKHNNGIKNRANPPESKVMLMCHPLCTCADCSKLYSNRDESDELNDSGQNQLILAAIEGDREKVEQLIYVGTSINFTDSSGKTGLHYAATKGYQDVLLLLINANIDVNYLDNDKNTALHLACDRGHDNCVKALIYSSSATELNLENSLGETPMFLATKYGYFEIVRLLLENGASVCVKNKRNQSVYSLAPNYYILKLFENFARKDQSKELLRECKKRDSNCYDATEIVIDNIRDCENCKLHGTKPKSVEEYKQIDLLLNAIENNDLPLACFYLGFNSNSENVMLPSIDKCHPLCACDKCRDNFELIRPSRNVSRKTVNINMCNAHGYTALHVAAQFGRTEILRLLLDSGVSPNMQTYKSLYTPLHLAVINLRLRTVKELLKCGSCVIDPLDINGNTPLYYACVKNDYKMIELLLTNGANCNLKNRSGHSILQIVEDNNQYRVFKLLKQSLCSTKNDIISDLDSWDII